MNKYSKIMKDIESLHQIAPLTKFKQIPRATIAELNPIVIIRSILLVRRFVTC